MTVHASAMPRTDGPADVTPPPAAAADADDRRRHDVRGRHRRAHERGAEDHAGRRRLAGEPVDRLDPVDAAADRLDDPPAAERGAEGQRGGTGEDGPRGRRRAREPAIGHEQRREQPDRLLGVVRAVAERQPGGHQPLAGAHRRRPAPRAVAQPSLHRARDDQGGERAEHGRDRQRDRRADDADRAQAVQPAPLHRVGPALDERRADEAAHERVARARRQPEPPRQRVPRHRRQQAGTRSRRSPPCRRSRRCRRSCPRPPRRRAAVRAC